MTAPGEHKMVHARIRNIRLSEKVIWRKVLEIYATSIDCDSGFEASATFFATVQNKIRCWMFFRG